MIGELWDAGTNAIRLRTTFKAITEDAELSAKEIEWLRKKAEDLGLVFVKIEDGYKRIASAAKNTRLEGEGVRKLFESTAKTATALNLTDEDIAGILYAYQQIITKNRLLAEEVNQQLGDRLPGAVRMIAEAVGVSTAELQKMMANGELLAEDVLPKLADVMEKRFGPAAKEAAKGPQQELSRLKNAWYDLKVQIGDKGFMDAAVTFVNQMRGRHQVLGGPGCAPHE